MFDLRARCLMKVRDWRVFQPRLTLGDNVYFRAYCVDVDGDGEG